CHQGRVATGERAVTANRSNNFLRVRIESKVREKSGVPVRELSKREHRAHETNLVDHDGQKPLAELNERAPRKVAAAVKITLPWRVGVIQHRLVFTAVL